MDPRRPRASILSLFDPLSGSPHFSVDKENNVGESSFFQPAGMAHKLVQPYIPAFKRRLIDVGDMTIDEPEMHDLLADEDELQDELRQNLAEDDDNDTLTFRDMAKAATPKWSGRHAATMATPKSSPTPRTPLAEISFKDEKTPMARKKSYRRTIMSVATKLAEVDSAQQHFENSSSPAPSNLENLTHASLLPSISPPIIEISFDNSEPQGTPESYGSSGETLGSSVCTLDLPTTTEPLIADTSIPVLISPPSPHLSPDVPILPTTHLRANPSPDNHANRLSVDLQSSFQFHLSSSDATFDLLNEKVSFFTSKDGIDSFLNNLEIDDSFGDEDFEEIKKFKGVPVQEFRAVRAKSPPTILENVLPVTEERRTDKDSALHNDVNQVNSIFVPELSLKATNAESVTGPSPIAVHRISKSSSPSTRNGLKARTALAVEESRVVPISTSIEQVPSIPARRKSVLSTPNSSSVLQHPPRPVPALKIVKRSRLVTQPMTSAATTTSSSRRSSIISATHAPTSRTNTRSSPPEAASASVIKNKQGEGLQTARGLKRVLPVQPFPSAGDGPRRVLISEGPKLNSASNSRTAVEHTKATSTIGPRRIVVAPPVTENSPAMLAKPMVQASSGLKQPVKYATAGPTSAIPKPIAREAGSKLPGPSSSKARFGVPTSGLGRRVT